MSTSPTKPTVPLVATLFAGSLACLACGQGVPEDSAVTTLDVTGRVVFLPALGVTKVQAVEETVTFRECWPCRDRDDVAHAALVALPGVAARYGHGNAKHRLRLALDGLAALGHRPPDKLDAAEVSALMRHLTIPGGSARWAARFAPVMAADADPATSALHPWSHLTTEQRAALREGYGALLADRVARVSPPPRLAPPEGDPQACAMCGVGSVEVSAAEVHCHGGTVRAREHVWRPVRFNAHVLGGPRTPSAQQGNLCPVCSDETTKAGAVGAEAMEGSYLRALRSEGRTDEVASIRQGAVPRLIGWAGHDLSETSAGRPPVPPNEKPWEHILVRRRVATPCNSPSST
ncbi:MAG: hypothetical protein V9G19_05745 [Tetrasphaera sp.]